MTSHAARPGRRGGPKAVRAKYSSPLDSTEGLRTDLDLFESVRSLEGSKRHRVEPKSPPIEIVQRPQLDGRGAVTPSRVSRARGRDYFAVTCTATRRFLLRHSSVSLA